MTRTNIFSALGQGFQENTWSFNTFKNLVILLRWNLGISSHYNSIYPGRSWDGSGQTGAIDICYTLGYLLDCAVTEIHTLRLSSVPWN